MITFSSPKSSTSSRERFHQLKEANLAYGAAMEEMNQQLGKTTLTHLVHKSDPFSQASLNHHNFIPTICLYFVFWCVIINLMMLAEKWTISSFLLSKIRARKKTLNSLVCGTGRSVIGKNSVCFSPCTIITISFSMKLKHSSSETLPPGSVSSS